MLPQPGALAPRSGPASGEDTVVLAAAGGAVVERIVTTDGPPGWMTNDHDEWVTVLHGGAALETADDLVELAPGDAVLIPAGTTHAVAAVVPGTMWLAVHLPGTATPADATPARGAG